MSQRHRRLTHRTVLFQRPLGRPGEVAPRPSQREAEGVLGEEGEETAQSGDELRPRLGEEERELAGRGAITVGGGGGRVVVVTGGARGITARVAEGIARANPCRCLRPLT